MNTVTATELARQTRQILDAVAGRGETVIIERNNMPVARIVAAYADFAHLPGLKLLSPKSL